VAAAGRGQLHAFVPDVAVGEADVRHAERGDVTRRFGNSSPVALEERAIIRMLRRRSESAAHPKVKRTAAFGSTPQAGRDRLG
jgi:hypothetical protein